LSAEGGVRAILAALGANAGIAVVKFAGFAITGSASMLAESVHSLADTSNQGLLLVGRKAAQRSANERHPFGYGRNRYFYSFVVALLLFTLGAVFAVSEGVEKILHPEPLTSPAVAVVILFLAACLEGYSFRTALAESRELRGGRSWWQFVREATNPELPVVLLEDMAALVGLLLALAAVVLTLLTGDPVWDGIGTVCIGVLLGIVAGTLIVEMKSLLIGEGVSREIRDRIVGELTGGQVRSVIHIRTEYLAPEQLLVAAKIGLEPQLGVAEVAAEIDAAEARVRAAVPVARLIYLEPDLERGSVREQVVREDTGGAGGD
jgi:cation diffusion facilitator family transporter